MARLRLPRLLLLLCIGIVLLVVGVFVICSSQAWVASRRLSSDLRDAREVRFVEFARGMISGEIVFSRVTAKPADIAALKSALSPWFAVIPPWRAMCFTPHHRVEIARADGSQARFEVCFFCHNFRFDNEGEATLPSSWQNSLGSFFTSVGMPPRSSEEYRTLIAQHPDRDVLDKALRDIDPQIDQKSHP